MSLPRSASSGNAEFHLDIDAELRLERFDASGQLQSMSITATPDRTLRIDSVGELPRVPLRQFFQLRSALRKLALLIDHDIIIGHQGKQVVRVRVSNEGTAKLYTAWWTLAMQRLVGH
ncbi:hypothetical protein [Crateriforma conspicua]|uniref:hypothetical protein n=1 Tax=Crateriforma conspicua TaxID=2527996 RepID=UPI00118C78C8|nr:hypothetical protein [Crateriforma conspicua]QDV61011.1 hypothetical protein Mal65_01320 [Crateriforma conspicua]